jgi:hypothetical protein
VDSGPEGTSSVDMDNKLTTWFTNHQNFIFDQRTNFRTSKFDQNQESMKREMYQQQGQGPFSVEHHEPLTTPGGSLQSNDRVLISKVTNKIRVFFTLKFGVIFLKKNFRKIFPG